MYQLCLIKTRSTSGRAGTRLNEDERHLVHWYVSFASLSSLFERSLRASAFVALVCSGMVGMLTLGIALDQIADPVAAGVIEDDCEHSDIRSGDRLEMKPRYRTTDSQV